MEIRGGQNGVFGKRCACVSDDQPFSRHFRGFPGSEEQNLVLWAENVNLSFRHFRQNHLVFGRGENTVLTTLSKALTFTCTLLHLTRKKP